jgi:hypothetical protein
MKIKTFYIAIIFVFFAISGYSQPLRLNTIRNSGIMPSGSENSTLSGNTRSTNLVHTKSIDYLWDGSGWVYYHNATYKYNADGQETEMIQFDTTRPMNHYKRINFYDPYKNSTGYVYYQWDSVGKKWDTIQGQRMLCQYNASHFITQKIPQQWTSSFYGWTNDPSKQREDYILDVNGKYTQMTVYSWSGTNWIPYYKDTICTWNGDQLSSYLEKIPNSTNGWKDDARYSTIFTGKNYIGWLEVMNVSGTSWDSLFRFTKTYDANGGSVLYQDQYNSANSSWEQAARSINYIDSLGNYTGFRVEERYAGNWRLNNGESHKFTYNSNEVILSDIWSAYNKNTDLLEPQLKFVYSEFKIPGTVTVKELSASNNIKVYPNPASDYIFIENNGNFKTNSSINLYDLNGRLILNKVNNDNNVKIDLNGLKAGIYLLEVNNDNGVSRNRILIK